MRWFPTLVVLFLSGCSSPPPSPVFVTCEGNEEKYQGTVIGLNAAGKVDLFKKVFWVDRASGTVSELLDNEKDPFWTKCAQSCQSSLEGNLIILRTKDDNNLTGRVRFTLDETIRVDLNGLSISGDGHSTQEYSDHSITDNDYRYRLAGTCHISERNPSRAKVPEV